MESVLIVMNAADGRRYRLSIKGSLGRVTGAKIKKYMVAHVQAAASAMVLKFDGKEMGNNATADEYGVKSGDTLVVEVAGVVSPRSGGMGATSVASSMHHQAILEADALDEQKGLFEQEAVRRAEEYQRNLNGIAVEMSDKERRAALLQNELKEMQLQAQRVETERQQALQEKQRLEDQRRAELDRQRQREAELQARQAQLLEERERHRQLELHRLELEKKQQLLEQQRAAAAAEKERVERDRREYEEQLARYEKQVLEKQTQLERERADHARRERELQHDMAVLQQKKQVEKNTVGRELELDELRLRAVMDGRSRQRTERGGSVFAGTPSRPLHPNEQGHSPHMAQQRTPVAHDGYAPPPPPPGVGAMDVSGAGRDLSRSVQSVGEPRMMGGVESDALAQANLEELGMFLRQPLGFDASNTCVVDVDDKHTVMISYDKDTEALYLYSSLLCNLPKDPLVKVQLYELVLEGALLGRDMAGGGVGLSLKDDFLLMCTCVPLHYTTSRALRLAFPKFADALRRWRGAIKSILTTASTASAPHADGDGASPSLPNPAVTPTPARPQPPTAPASWHPPAGETAPPPSARPSPSPHGDAADEYAVIGVELTDGVTIDGVHTHYNNGVIVVRVKGPAAAAGVEENDIIKVVNGRLVTNLAVFQDISRNLMPEAPAYFVIDRAGEELTLELRPQRGYRRPGEQQRKYRVAEEILPHASSTGPPRAPPGGWS